MPGASEVRIRGLAEMQRAFAKTNKDLSKDLRKTLREAAEPVRADAERRASSGISNIGNRWGRMRVGVTRNLVYVAPKERGRASRRNMAIRRPNLADLLMDRAMEPALDAHAGEIEREVGDALDDLFKRWER